MMNSVLKYVRVSGINSSMPLDNEKFVRALDENTSNIISFWNVLVDVELFETQYKPCPLDRTLSYLLGIFIRIMNIVQRENRALQTLNHLNMVTHQGILKALDKIWKSYVSRRLEFERVIDEEYSDSEETISDDEYVTESDE